MLKNIIIGFIIGTICVALGIPAIIGAILWILWVAIVAVADTQAVTEKGNKDTNAAIAELKNMIEMQQYTIEKQQKEMQKPSLQQALQMIERGSGNRKLRREEASAEDMTEYLD